MSRPRFAPTGEQRKLVGQLAAFGVPHSQIVTVIVAANGKPISINTLRKYFSDVLRSGATKANAQVAGALFRNAIDGNVAAQIFWLKTRARWSERNDQPQGQIVVEWRGHNPTAVDYD